MKFRNGVRLIAAALAVSAAAVTVAPPVHAQYFGRNKVQYKKFKFEVLKTAHFDIYFYPEEDSAAAEAGRMAERWYARYSHALGHHFEHRQPVLLYASHSDFEQTNALGTDEIGEGTGGVTEALKRRIVLPLAGPLKETDHVLGHELVHAFQFDMTGERAGTGFANPAALRLPLWFIEGMAEYMSLGPLDPNTSMWMRDAAARGHLPTIRQLDNPRYFPYRYGQALWAYIAGRWGEWKIGEILRAAARSGDAEEALGAALGETSDSLSKDWHASIKAWYTPIAEATVRPDSAAKPVFHTTEEAGDLNVGPALSPDGKQLVFLSAKELFSIEMYLADAVTGRVEHRLTKTAVDPHYQSLGFIQSAGAWSPDSKRFAFGGVVKGTPVLAIIDPRSGKRLKEVSLPRLGDILHPTWSPDGTKVAFAALVNGFTDLYVVDLATGQVQRLTHDPYAEMQPAWSPDGKSIAFVTDRFDTDVDSLRYGTYRLAVYDIATGKISALPSFPGAKHINPQWSNDGKSIFFVSDRGGISNVYRLELASGSFYQITNERIGVSGITDLSSTLSAARSSPRLVFCVYEKDSYKLYSLDGEAALVGTPIKPVVEGVNPALIPGGVVNTDTDVAAADSLGPPLPQVATFGRTPYSSKLSLDYISQPSVAVGVGSGGVALGGGATMSFSDMLGNHNLETVIQLQEVGNNFLNGLGLAGFYENRSGRWTWGAYGGQTPIITRNFFVDPVIYQGQSAAAQRDVFFWEIHREVGLQWEYPISRAQRIEMWTGFRNISFDAESHTQIYSDDTGALLADFNEKLLADSLSALNLGTWGFAHAYDTSIFGGTSPVTGSRSRLEATGAFGSLNYITALADIRKYIFLARPLTFASRFMQVGRYGRDSQSDRLSLYYLGYPWLVRGYDDGSFTSSEFLTSTGQVATQTV
ncbi:MAG TPA: peptidase S9, partial [Candidatus Eisenbacteria bacterium]|nr:peptidase S9 [Candidatus Eisenbacteria bacterium]